MIHLKAIVNACINVSGGLGLGLHVQAYHQREVLKIKLAHVRSLDGALMMNDFSIGWRVAKGAHSLWTHTTAAITRKATKKPADSKIRQSAPTQPSHASIEH